MMPHTGQRRDAECKRGTHKVELSGILPPWVLDRLYSVLEDAQGGQLQVLRALRNVLEDSSGEILDVIPYVMHCWVLLSLKNLLLA